MKRAKESQNKHNEPTFAPAFTKDELEQKATSEEIQKGDSTPVTILENDFPSGERKG
jgi:hypothetical protein